jgi:uncharacterized protein YbjT (DUF2867 family)
MHILIAGGTGTAGRVLARRAVAAGHHTRVLTRTTRSSDAADPDIPVRVQGDLTTGSGLAAAVAGVDAVVDLSNADTVRYSAAAAFFTTATHQLFAAEQRAGVGHHLTLSIVGADEFPSGYYRAKVDQEAAVVTASAATGVGHTIARVTQFHDFAATVLRRFRVGPLVLAPPLRIQPVHLDDVADHLLGLLDHGPVGRAAELGGPEPEDLSDMVRRYGHAVGASARVLAAPLVGDIRRANQRSVLRPRAGVRGGISFEQWLREVQSCSKQPNTG